MKKLLLFTIILIIIILTFPFYFLTDDLMAVFIVSIFSILVSGIIFISYLFIYNRWQDKELTKLLLKDIKNFGLNNLMGYKIKLTKLFNSSYEKDNDLGKVQSHTITVELKINNEVIGKLNKVRTINGIIYQYEYELVGNYFDKKKLIENLTKLGFTLPQPILPGLIVINKYEPTEKHDITISEETGRIIVSNRKIIQELNKQREDILNLIY
jgi:hypothetical protein